MHRARELVDRHLFTLMSGAVLAAAFLYMRRTTAGLHWPYDVDLFRDIGQANSVRNGHIFADQNFAGEVAHYNPLLSWILAALSRLTGRSTSTIATQGGIALNLLGPVVFTVLVRRWFGRLAAGFALVALLFIMCSSYPSWAVATYSPWLFQANFAQAPFYLALLALPAATLGSRRRDPIVFGALLGVVGLTHTGPSVVLLAVYVAVVLCRQRAVGRMWAATARRVAITGATAAIVASPLILPLVLKYQLHVLNEAPGRWIWDVISPANIGNFAWDFLVRWQLVVAAIGVGVWWRRERRTVADINRMITVSWAGVSFAALALATYAGTALPLADAVPAIVPSYHYLLYLSAALCVWFGVGCAALVRWALDRAALLDERVRRWTLALPAAAVVLAAVLVIPASSGWRARDDLQAARSSSIAIAQQFANFGVSSWIAEATPQDAVILYDLEPAAVLDVGALDERKTVVVDILFANPFVDWAVRDADSRTMLTELAMCRLEQFAVLADRYRVHHVVTTTGGALAASVSGCPGISVAYADDYATVLLID